jgi:hypothetical protein
MRYGLKTATRPSAAAVQVGVVVGSQLLNGKVPGGSDNVGLGPD